MPRLARFLLAIAVLLLITPARSQVFEMTAEGFQSARLPREAVSLPPQVSADLDKDGRAESLVLAEGQLAIRSGEQNRWESPAAWMVQQALIADLNQDKVPEAVLLVSRPFQPWPVDVWLPHGGRIDDFHDANGLSSHIILIGWKNGSFRELWAGSALVDPVTQIAVASPGGEGYLLVALEGKYDDPASRPARRVKLWKWNGFGFRVVSALDGPFSGMALFRAGDRQFVSLVR